ncbi:RHS repeat domain-containing protein [Riemerella columbipharyngis]|uniref:RHS repeat-associated core domain-containing protein n=1 Tax=Riemerella columbipharyngis TaxID=1071918 RepID=A0A1G7A706_9FLAO|nr:RHS repeat-associated core domain-containing protein [Riemerella columbipharyngis]SDE10609.1 RHS repeat-associated core domain-containing protein [Riemerella columbipharyngis]
MRIGKSGQLLKDEDYFYHYDGEGNLILKSRRDLTAVEHSKERTGWLSFGSSEKKKSENLYAWQAGDTAYEWYGNGMLKSVRTPEGETVRFEYDALGRRMLKETYSTCYRYAWDNNVLLHEWHYPRRERPRKRQDELERIVYEDKEPYTHMTTWVYDGTSFTPVAKLTDEDSYSIVQDYMGTPIQAFDSKGNVVWDCVLDIYGDVLELRGNRCFIPFRYQGQYEDEETGLYYNRFRYYSPNIGNYISQDPIGLLGGLNTYTYVKESIGLLIYLG